MRKSPYTSHMQRTETMLTYAEKQQTKRPVVTARANPGVDRQQLRAEINKRFSKSLELLAR